MCTRNIQVFEFSQFFKQAILKVQHPVMGQGPEEVINNDCVLIWLLINFLNLIKFHILNTDFRTSSISDKENYDVKNWE